MKKDKFNRRYKLHIELSFLIALLLLILLFYLYPRFAEKFFHRKLVEPSFIIVDIPPSIQHEKKVKPAPPQITAEYEELEILEDVDIFDEQQTDTTSSTDSLFAHLLYYDSLLPFSIYDNFDPNSLIKEKEPIDRYKEYLNDRLTKIFNDQRNYNPRSAIDDILAQSMGRDPNMLMVDVGAVIKKTRHLLAQLKNRQITINGILNTENEWYLLPVLWERKSHTALELYEYESVKKSNTVFSLKKSLNTLEKNGFLFKIEGHNEVRYIPAFNPDELIEIVNKLLAGNITVPQKDKLNSFLSFIIIFS